MQDEQTATSATVLAVGQILDGTGFQLNSPSDYFKFLDGSLYASERSQGRVQEILNRILADLHTVRLYPTAADVLRWRMAWHAIEVIRMLSNKFFPRHLLTKQCGDFPRIRNFVNVSTGLGFSIPALIYGGLHALAWNAHFHSDKEQLLWRLSSCIVMGGLPSIVMLYGVGVYLDKKPWFWWPVIYFSCFFTVCAYVLSRGYLVVECFVNLSRLPAGVYDVPNWSTYFPHIN